MPWLRLIRWSNLLIIFLTQGVAWWCVIWPQHNTVPLLLTPVNFLLLTASTILIAAAGYIINDYFDIRIDAINKPDAVILEKVIPRRSAIIVHSALNVVALLLSGIVAWRGHHIEWLFLQVICIVMLWKYSTTWKRKFMIGNVVVALMTALTILALIIYEPEVIKWRNVLVIESYKDHVLLSPFYILLCFAAFAFLLTWMREIVKDMEDFKGDEVEGCTTMPIRWGLLKASRFTQLLALVSIAFLTWIAACLRAISSYEGLAIAVYIALVILLPLMAWTYTLPQQSVRQHYKRKSRQLKLLMVAGILLLLFY